MATDTSSRLLAFTLIFVLSACEQPEEAAKLKLIEVPIWKKADLLLTKVGTRKGFPRFTTEHQVLVRPARYTGGMPLRFKSKDIRDAGDDTKVIAYEFEGFTNFFIYDGNLATGAQAYVDDNLVAEARVEYVVDSDKNWEVFLEEFHYDSEGKLVFTSRSKVGPAWFNNVSELHRIGSKAREYFFVWPQ